MTTTSCHSRHGALRVQAFLGLPGVAVLAVLDIANALAVCVGSYLLFASAGPAFPEQYK